MPRRKCGFNSRRVLFDVERAHECGALSSIGVWESLGIRRFRVPETVGSNPTTPTFAVFVAQRGLQTTRPFAEWPVLVSGRRLLNASSQVRFLPPQL